MIKEALEYLNGLIQQSNKPVRLDLPPGNYDEQLYAVGGELKQVDIKPLPRNHQVDLLADLMSAAQRFANEKPSIFHDLNGVVLVIDDAEHRKNTFEFKLTLSDLWKRFRTANETWFDQKSFIRLLRIEMFGALQSPALIDAIRTIRFDVNSVQTGTVDRQRESMGREITSKVKAAGDELLPEAISFWIPVYSDPGERQPYEVQCALETDAVSGRLRFCALPGAIDLLEQEAIASIRDRLEEGVGESAFIYQGRP